MVDTSLIDQALEASPPEAPTAEDETPETFVTKKHIETPAPAGPMPIATASILEQGLGSGVLPGAIPGGGVRTGEHTDIQKMYRLTPTAQKTIQRLSMSMGANLGFDVNNSAVIRSVLRVMHDALSEIEQAVDEKLTPRKQPSTAIGNEHARDELEQEIADAILSGILRYAEANATK